MGKFSAGDAAFYGLGMVKRDPLTFLGVTILLTAYCIAMIAVVAPAYATFAEVMMEADESDPTAALSALGGFFGAIGLLYLLMIPLYAVMLGAINRSLIFGASRGWILGLKLGMDEVRVFIVSLVGCILVFAIYLGCVLAAVALGGMLTAVTQSPAAMVVVLLGYIAALVLMIWIGIRLALAGPASVGEGRFVIFESWGMTKGRFWTLFLGYLILCVIVLVVEFVALMIAAMIAAGAMAGMDPAQFEDPEFVFEMISNFRVGPVVLVITALYGVVASFFTAAMLGVAARGYLDWKESRSGGVGAA